MALQLGVWDDDPVELGAPSEMGPVILVHFLCQLYLPSSQMKRMVPKKPLLRLDLRLVN